VDSVLTVRELARLIRLYGIDTSNIEHEPADEPMSEEARRNNAEVSGGIAEGVIRTYYYQKNEERT